MPDPIATLGSDTARSLHVLRRFAFKVTVFCGWAAFQAVIGSGGFSRPFASMVLISAAICQVAGIWRAERVWAPHWTYFDEAAWLLVLGLASQRLLP